MIAAALFNEKPGTTKTTGAVWLAHALYARGLAVLLVDADRAGSAQRWADLAADPNDPASGFPFDVVGMYRRTIGRDLPKLARRGRYDAVVIDTPQLEDHAVVARGAMAAVGAMAGEPAPGRSTPPAGGWWIVPVAPSGIEVDRTVRVLHHMDEVAAILPAGEPRRLALLTRTNTAWPTKGGPDAKTRRALEKVGLPVFEHQVPDVDSKFRQTFGATVDPTGTAYAELAAAMMDVQQVQHVQQSA